VEARFRDPRRPPTLELDSPTAVRALNAVVAEGVPASLALESSGAGPAGTAMFGVDDATRNVLDSVGGTRPDRSGG